MVKSYELLANAIVEQAARDYERCLVDDHVCSSPATKANLREVESFFKGDLIKVYTKLDGPSLMERIKKEVITYDYDLKALYKARGSEFEEESEDE